MSDDLENLLTMYEARRLDRRQLLAALALVTASASARAQAPAPAFHGRIINHVTLGVSDLGRARTFYEGLLGARAQKELPNQVDLRIGDSFVTVLQSTQPAVIQHFCVGVQGFDGDQGLGALQQRYSATAPRLVTNELGQKQLILKDPDGITVEIADVKYRL
jgi:catechol 2,3-dioxygenase-like lactoylglutathione lyase family enzyme